MLLKSVSVMRASAAICASHPSRMVSWALWGPLCSIHPAWSSRQTHQHPAAPLHLQDSSCTLTLNRDLMALSKGAAPAHKAQWSSTGGNTQGFWVLGLQHCLVQNRGCSLTLWEAENAGAGLNVITQTGCQLCSPFCPISCSQLIDVEEPRGHGCCWEEIQTSSTQLGFACKLAWQPLCGGGSAEPRACVSVWHMLTHEGTLLPVRSHRETSGDCPEPPLGLLMCCWGMQ